MSYKPVLLKILFHLHSFAHYEPLMNIHSSLSSSKVRYWQTWDQQKKQGLSYQYNPFVLCSEYVVLKIGDTRKKKSCNPQDSPNTGDTVIPLTNTQKIRNLQPSRNLWAASTQGIETRLWDQFIELHLSKGAWGATSINENGNPEKQFIPESIFWLLGLIVPVFPVHFFDIPFFSIEDRNNFWRSDWVFLLNKVWLGLHWLQLARLMGSPKYENRSLFSMLLHPSLFHGSSLALTQSDQHFLCLQSLHGSLSWNITLPFGLKFARCIWLA